MIKNLNTIIKDPEKDMISKKLIKAILELNEANLPALGSLGTIEKVLELYTLSS